MIAFLEGKTAGAEENRLYLDVNGVGYEIFMPARSLARLDPNGQDVLIYTCLSVREDAVQLFGFLSRDDKYVFQLLLGVSGIGPKAALNILSTLSADELRFAVFSDDIKTLVTVPGLGKKTAQKLVLELKDRLNLEDTLDHGDGDQPVPAAEDSSRREAIEALRALGYSGTEAVHAVNRIPNIESLSVEEILRLALREIGV